MVIFELECAHKHRFEGWFRDAKSFESQSKRGMVECPVCGVSHVMRVPSGCHVGAGNSNIHSSSSTKETSTSTESVASSTKEIIASTEKTTENQLTPVSQKPSQAAAQQVQADPIIFLKALHHYVKANSKNVGEKFADTAIKMHRNEIPAESISGTASKEQIERLDEEGVTYVPIPKLPESVEN